MNYIQHLNTFLWLLQRERRLTPSHISLYLALFHHWNCYRFQNPFPLFRERLMQISGIGSKNTYSKCLKELHQFGYIVHNPSLHKNHRPKVSLIRWQLNPEVNRQLSVFQANIPSPPGNEPLTGSDMGHLLTKIGTLTNPDPVNPSVNTGLLTGSDLSHNDKQCTNSRNLESDTHAPPLPLQDSLLENPKPGTPGAPATAPPASSLPPPKDEVFQYFSKMNYPELQASRFFAHYQANGWQQAGKVPIKNWQAAADKWMSYTFENKNDNENKTTQYARARSTELPGHHQLQQNKNYEEPL